MSTWLHQHRVGVHFCIKVVAYTVILLALIYLYDYNGVNGGHFIYNEF
nr:teichoic acid D-Ala incorporation-associated protein DltX [Secundilactobacillus odoratitofui]